MINIYKDWKLFDCYNKKNIRNIKDISYIYWKIKKSFIKNNIKIPIYCEEPLQYIMRENWFIIQGF